jgi:hypothetical protein
VVFQRGHNRAEYELALPLLVDYYSIIRRSSDVPFSVETAARLDLEQALAALQAAIYQRPEDLFREHAKARADAMLRRDSAAENGSVSE